MENLIHKNDCKQFSAKKNLFLMITLCLFLILPMVSADLSIDNIKLFDDKTGDYGKVTIRDWFGFLDLAELELKENTDICDSDCSSETEIIMYQRGVLIDDVKFMKLQGKGNWIEEDIIDYNFYIKTGEKEIDVDDYGEKCVEINKNLTCSNVLVGSHKEMENIYELYNLGDEVIEGTYYIKLEGEKGVSDTIDWQITSQGKLIDEWALWEASYTGEHWDTSATGNDNPNDMGENATAIFIADYTDSYIYVYNNSGTSMYNFTTSVESAGARGVAYYNDFLYINDIPSQIDKYDLDGTYLSAVTLNTEIGASIDIYDGNLIGITAALNNITFSDLTTGDIFYSFITNISNADSRSLTTDGNYIYVGDRTDNSIYIYNMSGGYLINYSQTAVNNYSAGMVVYGNNLWLSDAHTAEVYKYELISAVTLNSPIDNYYSTRNVTFNATGRARGALTFVNASLWHNKTGTFEINETKTITGITNTTTFNKTFGEGSVLWNTQFCLSDHTCVFGDSNRTFHIDSTFPAVTITSPTTNMDYGESGENETINWTATDTNLDSCWFEYNMTNTSVTCGANNYSFMLEDGVFNITFYANDSAGNTNSSFIEWIYKVFVLDETYVASTISGVTNEFLLELETDGTQVTIGYLNYNNTNILGSISSSGDYYNLTRNQIAVGVSIPTNISFYWNVTMEDGYNFTLVPKNQSVSPVVINETCGAGMYVLFNFTMVDEITQIELDGAVEDTSIKVDLDLYTLDGTIKLNDFYQNFSQTNPVAICIDNNLSEGEEYSIDVQVQYSATNYSSEFYNIEKYVINLTTLYNNITLYDLDNTNTQNFKLIARDTSYLPIDGALIQIERKYVDEGVFYITEIPKADAKGITSASLQLNDVVYNFYIYQAGVLISSFTNVLAICQTPLVSSCEIDFNAFQTKIEVPDFEEGDDFNFTLGYNDTSKVITSQFIIPSREPSVIYLEVIREDTLGTAVCSDTLTSASGILSCIVPHSFGNSTVVAKIYKDGVEQGKGGIKTDQNPSDIFGVVLIMMSILIMMTLIGIGVSDNPVITGVFIFVGLILMVAMNLVKNTGFIGATATILFFLIAIILVIIKAAKRS